MQQAKHAEVVAFEGQAKFAIQAFQINVADDQIRLRRNAIGDDRALYRGNDGLHVGFVKTQNGGAVKRHAIDELNENFLNFFERGVLVERLSVDGGDDRDDRSKQQEAAIAFIGFHYKVFTFAEARGGAGLIHFAADDE